MSQPAAVPLHIIEPTLHDEVGHCMSLVRALTQAARQAQLADVHVWCAQEASAMAWDEPATCHPHFHRRWRRVQALSLFARLLREPGRMLIATASSTDLISLDWVARWCSLGTLPRHKVSLFVHWLNVKPGKARWFQAIARRQPHIQILAPTTTVAQFFSDCGFHAQVVPYPVDLVAPASPEADKASAFRHVLVAGGARMDKGLAHVVALVRRMQQQGCDWPVTVQISMEERHQKDHALVDAIEQLANTGYAPLVMNAHTMDRASYSELFQGAVVLQPYSAQDFRDRVSGVTLDALGAGAPCVVTAGTWMDRTVSQYQAGVATADLSAPALMQALNTVVQDYPTWAARARQAAQHIQAAHSARTLIDAVMGNDLPAR